MRPLSLVALVAAVLVAAACGPAGTTGVPTGGGLSIAAASLRAAATNLAAAYRADHPDLGIIIATDSSAALRAQVQQGAPFLARGAGPAWQAVLRPLWFLAP